MHGYELPPVVYRGLRVAREYRVLPELLPLKALQVVKVYKE
jgi:hypothetical protein